MITGWAEDIAITHTQMFAQKFFRVLSGTIREMTKKVAGKVGNTTTVPSAEWESDELSSAVVECARNKLEQELGEKRQSDEACDSEVAQLAAFRII